MFEELYRNLGILRIPNDQYLDSQPQFDEYPVSYFMQESTFRDDSGILQAETAIFCKGCDLPAPAGSQFVSADREIFDITVSRRIFDHFENGFECYKLTVKK